MPIIEARDLRKTFRAKQKRAGLRGSMRSLARPEFREIEAVSGISFDCEAGELIAFIGPNGAGKSTTIKMLTGILMPTSGGIRCAGLDPSRERKQLAHSIGTVFGQLLIGILMLAAGLSMMFAVFFFRHVMKRYESGNLMVVRM